VHTRAVWWRAAAYKDMNGVTVHKFGLHIYSLGHLKYDSRKYDLGELGQEGIQGQAILKVEDNPEGCVRIIECKHFLKEPSKTT